MRVCATAPGRINLMGDHVDYVGGLMLPMAIDLRTCVELAQGGSSVRLRSADDPLGVDVALDPRPPWPGGWGDYVAAAVAQLRPPHGAHGLVTTTIPLGAGLSSSGALVVALTLALGFQGSPLEVAQVSRIIEQRASGLPCGIMDQLAAAAGVEGSALLMDARSGLVEPVALPPMEVYAVHCGRPRQLVESAYASRRADCLEAERLLGPLRDVEADAVEQLPGVLRRRARHVVTEIARVREMVAALRAEDLEAAGDVMRRSHDSLRDDMQVSTPVLDRLVEELRQAPGVHGARLTGGGFGGCVVVIARPGTRLNGWRLRASGPAQLRVLAD